MFDFDSSSLRAQVISDFEVMARDIADAAALDLFIDAVMRTAVGAVREGLHLFNQQNAATRLPVKILAACFANLDVRFGTRPSHVCRSWRAAALGEPALWSHVASLPQHGNKLELIRMHLSRAGTLPVNLVVDIDAPTEPDDVYGVIAPYSNQLRYLAWHSEIPTNSWDLPMQNLEGFCCTRPMTITPALFGGEVGRLRCLYLQCVDLPPVCPVLSTVTELSVRLVSHKDGTVPSTLENLFHLCPCLHWLQIFSITKRAMDMLPEGPAPTSLRELVLSGNGSGCDLMPLYLSWDSGNLDHVSISQRAGTHVDLAPLASGTTTLAVRHSLEYDRTCFMFESAEGTVSHSVTLFKLAIDDAAALLAAVLPSLTAVHTVIISHVALQPLAGVLTALPNLTKLVVHIVPKPARAAMPYPRPFAWEYLSSLSHLALAMPALRAIILQAWSRLSPDAHHARGLLAQLRALNLHGLPTIEIQGFTANAVASAHLTGLNLRFDTVTPVRELLLHKPRKLHYPFP